MKNNKGFSLVELIIVIAIMAVLVGVLAPTYLQYVEKSKKSNDVSTIDSIVNACEIGAIDPEVMTDPTLQLIITVDGSQMSIEAKKANTDDDADPDSLVTMDPNTETSQWQKMVEAAVGSGSDVHLKSTNWAATSAGTANTVVITATRNIATGKVDFTYGTNTAGNSTADSFKTYATSLSKIS